MRSVVIIGRQQAWTVATGDMQEQGTAAAAQAGTTAQQRRKGRQTDG